MKSSFLLLLLSLLFLSLVLTPNVVSAATGGGGGKGATGGGGGGKGGAGAGGGKGGTGAGAAGRTEDDDYDDEQLGCYDARVHKKGGTRNLGVGGGGGVFGKVSCDEYSVPKGTSAPPASRPLDQSPDSRPLDDSSESAPAPSPPSRDDAEDFPTSNGGDEGDNGQNGGDDGENSGVEDGEDAAGEEDGGGDDGEDVAGDDDGDDEDGGGDDGENGAGEEDGGGDEEDGGDDNGEDGGGDNGGDGEDGGGDDREDAGGENDGEDDDACKTDNGVFGALEGDALVVPFLYTIELSEEVPYAEYVNTVVPRLEVDMNDYVVPFLFENCAGSAVEVKQQQAGNDNNVRRHRHLAVTIVGMTSDPFDFLTTDSSCDVQNCYGMLGQVTLYLKTNADDNNNNRRGLLQVGEAMTVSEQLRTALKQGMDDGQFDNNPPIARVTFVDGNGGGGGGDGGGGTSIEDVDRTINTGDGGADAKLVAPLVVAGGLAVIIIAAILVRRRRSHSAGDAENASLAGGSATTPAPSDTVAASENVNLPLARSGSDIVSVS